MTYSISTSTIRRAELTDDEAKAFLAIGIGFEPRNTTLTVKKDDNYQPYELVEETTAFEEEVLASYKKNPDLEPPFVDTTLMQLKEWDSSPREGNAVARRAWEIIEFYQRKIEKLEGIVKQRSGS